MNDDYEPMNYQDGDISLAVYADEQKGTLWLAQNEMAKLFGIKRQNVLYHIRNEYQSGGLEKGATCQKNFANSIRKRSRSAP